MLVGIHTNMCIIRPLYVLYSIGHSRHPNNGFLASTFLFFVPHLYPPRPGFVVTTYAAALWTKRQKKMSLGETLDSTFSGFFSSVVSRSPESLWYWIMQVIFELFLATCTQSALRFINLHYTYGRPICVMEVSEYIFVFYFCTEIYIIYIAQGKYTLRLATSLTNLKDLFLKTRLHCKCCGF